MDEYFFLNKISDEFWALIEPLIPLYRRDDSKDYQRQEGGGRKPIASRKVFEGILYVLRTGCPWQDIPRSKFGNPSSIHKHFKNWLEMGFFENLWNAGLAEHIEMAGISWCWDRTEPSTPHGSEVAVDKDEAGTTEKKKRKAGLRAKGLRKWRPAVEIRNRG